MLLNSKYMIVQTGPKTSFIHWMPSSPINLRIKIHCDSVRFFNSTHFKILNNKRLLNIFGCHLSDHGWYSISSEEFVEYMIVSGFYGCSKSSCHGVKMQFTISMAHGYRITVWSLRCKISPNWEILTPVEKLSNARFQR